MSILLVNLFLTKLHFISINFNWHLTNDKQTNFKSSLFINLNHSTVDSFIFMGPIYRGLHVRGYLISWLWRSLRTRLYKMSFFEHWTLWFTCTHEIHEKLVSNEKKRTHSSKNNKIVKLTAKYCGPRAFKPPTERLHKLAVMLFNFFCSFSFCVSANFTTIGALQPYKIDQLISFLFIVVFFLQNQIPVLANLCIYNDISINISLENVFQTEVKTLL